MGLQEVFDYVQVSRDGNTVWVHACDGSTVGRFSKIFGMDVHRTVTEQMNGQPQCLKCTHEAPGLDQWIEFCDLMEKHYKVIVSKSLISFDK